MYTSTVIKTLRINFYCKTDNCKYYMRTVNTFKAIKTVSYFLSKNYIYTYLPR